MTRPILAALLLCCLAPFGGGCAATHPVTAASVARALIPETVSFGVTAPNLFSGPIVVNKGPNESRRDSVGVVGATLSFTYRLKPIRIERAEVQPVRVVRGSAPLPAPFTESEHGNP